MVAHKFLQTNRTEENGVLPQGVLCAVAIILSLYRICEAYLYKCKSSFFK